MANFKIEVELDWINNCEEGIDIDEEIREAVVSGVKNELLGKATKMAMDQVQKCISDQIKDSKDKIDKAVDSFIESVCSGKIKEMKIPHKEDTWGTTYNLIPISKYVGMRYEEFLNRNVLDERGNSGRTVSINKYFIDQYLEKELGAKVVDMISKAKQESEKMVLKTLETNLKEQLAAETIKKMNIPKLLENLQQKAIEFENKQESEG